MADSVKARHVLTGITVEIPVEQFKAMAFTPLHKNYEVLSSDSPVDCIPCNSKADESEELPDLGEQENYDYDYDPEEGEDD